MNSESVDLIYLDPPFNSKATYSAPIGSKAAGATFKDSWTWDDVDRMYLALLQRRGSVRGEALHTVIESARLAHSKGLAAYLSMMSQRLEEMYRLLKPTGSLYLHCDPTASHYLKAVLDSIFGHANFRNEVIWHYGKMSNTSRNFPKNHDNILRYAKSAIFTFNPIRGADSEYKERYKRHVRSNKVFYGDVKQSKDKLITGRTKRVERELGRSVEDSDILFDFDQEFKIQGDVMYVSIIKGNSAERTGFPTQKPLALLDRIIRASSNPGDIVLDPFCGCATTCVAAEALDRQWIGIDIASKAAELVCERLQVATVDRAGGPLFADDVIHRTEVLERTDLGRLPRYTAHKDTLYGATKNGECGGCLHPFPKRNLTVDHIVPRSKGGTDHKDNLWLLCQACNSSKGTKSQAEFLRDRMKIDSQWFERHGPLWDGGVP